MASGEEEKFVGPPPLPRGQQPDFLRRSTPAGSFSKVWAKVRKGLRPSNQARERAETHDAVVRWSTDRLRARDLRSSHPANDGSACDNPTTRTSNHSSSPNSVSEAAEDDSSAYNESNFKVANDDEMSSEQQENERSEWIASRGITATTVVDMIHWDWEGDGITALPPMPVKTVIEGPTKEEKKKLMKRKKGSNNLRRRSSVGK